ncbi:MAG: LuxR C-terminal-related transcriptional regulator [Bacilli bacterium]|nr:LuxR C-terminal-related transcriptional regulator [bacterium]MDY3757180.1 LuxR C-terminal-related transcriptional regulator [Bacilli bacterium]
MQKSILTNREKEIFELLVLNKSTDEISNYLGISQKTVRNHISNVMQKLNVKNRSIAILELIKLGEISL